MKARDSLHVKPFVFSSSLKSGGGASVSCSRLDVVRDSTMTYIIDLEGRAYGLNGSP